MRGIRSRRARIAITASRGTLRIVSVCALVLVLAPAAAAAAVRYAGPSGSGTTCSSGSPCSLAQAITAASQSDEIVVQPGSYSVSTTISTGTYYLDIHGEAGQATPIISWTGGFGTILSLEFPNLSDLSLGDSSGGDALNILGGTLSDLIIDGSASGGGELCHCYGGTLSDSVVLATGGAGVGVDSNGANASESLYNDTIVTTASGVPALALYEQNVSNAGGTLTLNATNVIADNVAGGPDVLASGNAGDPSESLTITMQNSDYRDPATSGAGTSIVNAGGNISAPPVFAGGLFNFHEAPTSPTIGTGLTNATNDGSVDFDGNPRSVSGLTDMGAYEYQFQAITASASAAAPTATTKTAVTFNASGTDPNAGAGALTYSWRFDDGATATGASVTHTFTTPATHTATVTVSDGTPYVATATASVTVTQAPAAPVALPMLSGATLTVHQPKAKHGKHKAKPFTASLGFTLNTPATVNAEITKVLKGKRVHGHCRTARLAKAAPCPTSKPVTSFTIDGLSGANTDVLPGNSLRRGSYTLTLTVGSSPAVTLDFTVR